MLIPKAPPLKPGPSAPDRPGSTPEAQFQELLVRGDLPALNLACQEAVRFDFVTRLRLLQARLLAIAPAPQPLPVVLMNANALLSCQAPDAALTVLNRYSPKTGPERDQWLIQRWRAAQAGLHHRLAAESLELLARGRLASLETIALPLQLRWWGLSTLLLGLRWLAGRWKRQRQPLVRQLVPALWPLKPAGSAMITASTPRPRENACAAATGSCPAPGFTVSAPSSRKRASTSGARIARLNSACSRCTIARGCCMWRSGAASRRTPALCRSIWRRRVRCRG